MKKLSWQKVSKTLLLFISDTYFNDKSKFSVNDRYYVEFICLAFLQTLASFLCFCGVMTRKPRMMLPWLILSVCSVFALLGLTYCIFFGYIDFGFDVKGSESMFLLKWLICCMAVILVKAYVVDKFTLVFEQMRRFKISIDLPPYKTSKNTQIV